MQSSEGILLAKYNASILIATFFLKKISNKKFYFYCAKSFLFQE